MSRFLPLFLDCRKGPSGFLSDYYYLLIDFRAARRVPRGCVCAAVGWCEGVIKAVNTDARKIITRGEPANFFVYYLVDDDTSKHNLTLDGYGADDRWVLLEPTA